MWVSEFCYQESLLVVVLSGLLWVWVISLIVLTLNRGKESFLMNRKLDISTGKNGKALTFGEIFAEQEG